MTMSKHISWDEMLGSLEGRAALGREKLSHLSRCRDCENLKTSIESLLGSLSMASGDPPTEELIRKAWLRMRSEAAAGRAVETVRSAGRALKELWATLSSESMAPSLAVRGVAPAPRLLIYKADGHAVTLSIKAGDRELVDVLGRVVPEASSTPPSGKALLTVGGETHESALDFGAFRFESIPRSTLRLEIEADGLLIHLPELPESEMPE